MVRGLTVGIYQNKSEKSPQRKVDDIEKKGETPSFVIDGQSLAYYILTPKDKDHSWEFANGGDYNNYAQKIVEFFNLLANFKAQCTIVLPLPDGTGPVTENSLSKWNGKAQDKIRRVSRVRQLLEKTAASSRGLLDVLPPFMLDEIAITAAKLNVPVLYTRNSVYRFIANYLKEGKADAVIGNNSDYVIFEHIKYIPIDSFFNDENKIWQCYYMTPASVCDILGLNDQKKLIDLAILLGDDFTEKFVTQKYNIYTLLRIKPRQNNPAALVEGIVDWLNLETYEGLENTSPIKELIADDAEFKAVIDESRKYFSLEDLLPEGDSEVRKLVDEGKLPLWTIGISENNDFWYEPVVDDYKHEVMTSKVTLPLRQIIYGILGRKEVIEHIPTDEAVSTETVQAEADLPELSQILKMKKPQLEKTFYMIAHSKFPKQPNPKDDPVSALPEPFKILALSLRYLIAQCFTENQANYTRTPEDNKKLKDAGVIGAPPIDLFELRALAAQALCLIQLPYSQWNNGEQKAPEFKPKLRRLHVAALYEVVLQHMLWLQQVFGQKNDKAKPHRFFDGQIFAAAYDAEGMIGSDKFAPFYQEPAKIRELEETRLHEFIQTVLYPFPDGLFEAFSHVPRSLGSAAFEEVKPQVATIVAPKSAFANLMDSSDEEDAPVEAPPAPVINQPPPPAAKAEEKKKKAEMDEDEEMAFLMAAAAANKGAKREVKQATKPQKSKGPQRRRVEKVNLNEVKNFNKESKLEAKLQTKQQGFDW
ncbi:hypothetical protein TVAG_256150 [Trichomonas vaginalis G3]|uniref:XPG N-terminal domain containing protein n=1 Tax=Trichomonas vaginalis (strain ATCC PRA-98 / G3) TaxID=412133 RepID=A2FYA9_TRIV3|nr:asteroid protein family [Trichomonas vaginalis G3]EAX90110.1 hypothetical protein TVAG_256150 [Trichomonas vaginalis G3]KAI5521659.1 asteroid protein family [Trichomonas vaginalis G3]|eukprot:XP_001303040.1 hypothetical protein [Trichomonas vaginalis G3]